MLRSVKYGLYGAVLAGLVAVPTLWSTVDKKVDLVVDGQGRALQTTAQDVRQVLSSEGYRLTAHDLVAPSPGTHIENGTRIVLRRGRLLHLDIDGVRTDVWTTAPTVAEALSDLGYSARDFVSVSRSRRLPLGTTDIAIRTPRLVTVVHDGSTEQVTTTEQTVGALLDDLDLTLGPNDRVSVSSGSAVKAGETIRIERVTRRMLTRIERLPYPIIKRQVATMPKGTTEVVRAGVKGQARDTYAMVYIDGQLAGHTLVRTVVLARPVPQIEKIGTQPPALAPNAPAPSPGTAKAIARQLVDNRGWSTAQYDCLVILWNNESSWNVHAANSSTGAYGIPQALPGDKMASAGPDWENNATTQITWGLGYISERYGTPCGAWSYWQGHGWY